MGGDQPPYPKTAMHRHPSQVMENRLDSIQPILNYLNWVLGRVGQGGTARVRVGVSREKTMSLRLCAILGKSNPLSGPVILYSSIQVGRTVWGGGGAWEVAGKRPPTSPPHCTCCPWPSPGGLPHQSPQG